jgi:hypothetical protein
MYLFENAKKKNLKNEDVFFLLRFAITGNPVGAPIGEICEIIGQKDVLDRIDLSIDYINTLKPEDLADIEDEDEKTKEDVKEDNS